MPKFPGSFLAPCPSYTRPALEARAEGVGVMCPHIQKLTRAGSRLQPSHPLLRLCILTPLTHVTEVS